MVRPDSNPRGPRPPMTDREPLWLYITQATAKPNLGPICAEASPRDHATKRTVSQALDGLRVHEIDRPTCESCEAAIMEAT